MNHFRTAVFVFVLGFLSASAAAEVKVLQDFQSWEEARRECQSQGGSGSSCDLVTRSELDQEWTRLGLSGDDSYWIGGQYFYRWLWDEGKDRPKLPLFQSHGCYKLQREKLDEAQFHEIRYNGPHQCYVACQNQGFVYLQGNNCYCASTLEGVEGTSEKCDIPCTGSAERCGAKRDYFSVYSIPPEIHFVDEYGTVNCAVGRRTNDILQIRGTLCGRSRHFFCVSDLQSDEIDARSETFGQAVYRCDARYRSTLPTLSAYNRTGQLLSDLRALSDKLTDPIDGALFWLPLQRHVRAQWVDGEEGEEGDNFWDCLAATPRTASYRLSGLPCSETHAAICSCSSVTDPGDSGNKDDEETFEIKGATKIAIIVAVVFVFLVCGMTAFIFLRRHMRWKHAEEILMREGLKRFENENPIFKG